MKIIIISHAKGSNGKGGYKAELFGADNPTQCFAKNEIEALRGLTEDFLESNARHGRIGLNLYQIHTTD